MTVKRFFWTIALFLTASAAMAVLAQPPAGGPGGGSGRGAGIGFGGPGALLQNEKVKAEINLTDEQVAQLKKVSEEFQPPRRERGGNRGEQAGPGGANPAPPSREEFEKRRTELQNKINQILKPEQLAKVQVLTFQLGGGLDSPFLGARSLETLNLTEEQKTKIKAIEDQRGEKLRAAFQDARNLSQEEREKRRTEFEASGKEFAQQIKAVLTPEQKTKAEQLTAEAKEVRQKLGIPEAGQRGGQQRGDGERRERGGDGYRPGANSWQPGQGAAGQEPQDNQPKKRFPRSEKPAEN
ncbi:MAG: hypothetical protein LBT46_02435 [Planctomycetaceae bacterium]|nr:hypothetical protein [Planctomycetaceae bacterium]